MIEGVPPCGHPPNDAWRDFVLARDARDLSLLFEVLAGPREPEAPRSGRRVGVLDHDPELGLPVDAACVRAVHAAATLLEQLGFEVEAEWPHALDGLWQRAGHAFGIIADATRPPVLRWIEERLGRPVEADDVPGDVFEAATRDAARTPDDRVEARSVIDTAIRPLSVWWDDHDLLVTPATFKAGWPLGGHPGLPECGTLAAPFSLTGQPSIVVPIPDDETRAPIGVQIVGRRRSDRALLGLANTLQTHLGWLSFTPPIFATSARPRPAGR